MKGLVLDIKRNNDTALIGYADGKKVNVTLDAFDRKPIIGELVESKDNSFKVLGDNKAFIKQLKDKWRKEAEERYAPLFNNVMEHLKHDISNVYAEVKFSKIFGCYNIIRFHNDADGISSAFSFYKILNATYIQQNSVVYSIKDALNDINFSRGFNPTLILLDFGSNEESIDGVEIAKKAGFNVIIVDHHPPSNKMRTFVSIVNPLFYDEEASRYTAGYLSYEIARLFGIESDLYKVSFAGDRSDLIPLEDKYKDKALVLDFLATYNVYGNNLLFYLDVINNENLYNTILMKAKEKLNDIKQGINSYAKITKLKKGTLVIIDLAKLANVGEFPSVGKIASIVSDMFDNAFIIGFYEKGLIFRVSKKLINSTNAHMAINYIKEHYNDLIINGGGHKAAASLRVKGGYGDFIKDEVINFVKALLNEE